MLIRLIEALLVLLIAAARRLAREIGHRRRAALSSPVGEDLPLGVTVPERSGHEAEAVRLPPLERRQHLYILGRTGCGKTSLILRLLESDIRERRTFCVFDLRGDLVDRVLLRLAASGEPEEVGKRLLLVDLREQDWIVGYNPLSGSGETYHRALHLLSVLRGQAESWGVQLEETLRCGLMALAETGWTLLEMEPLLTKAGFRREVMARVSDPAVRSFFERYAELSDEKRLAWALAVLNKVTPLLSVPQLRLVLGQRDGFSFPAVLDGPPGGIVLVSLAIDRLHGTALLLAGLLLSNFQTAIMARADRPEKARQPVSLYVDEFENFAGERFETILAEGRRFGLGLCLSHQSLAQIPPRLKAVVRNNAATQILFGTGAVDAAELASELGGPWSREEARQALMAHGTGEAFLVRRGRESVRVRFSPAADPVVPVERLETLKAVSLAAFGRRRDQVDQELSDRMHWLAGLKAEPSVIIPDRTAKEEEDGRRGRAQAGRSARPKEREVKSQVRMGEFSPGTRSGRTDEERETGGEDG